MRKAHSFSADGTEGKIIHGHPLDVYACLKRQYRVAGKGLKPGVFAFTRYTNTKYNQLSYTKENSKETKSIFANY